jgi:hypothetical protein
MVFREPILTCRIFRSVILQVALWLSNDEKLRLDNKLLLRNQILDTLAENQ